MTLGERKTHQKVVLVRSIKTFGRVVGLQTGVTSAGTKYQQHSEQAEQTGHHGQHDAEPQVRLGIHDRRSKCKIIRRQEQQHQQDACQSVVIAIRAFAEQKEPLHNVHSSCYVMALYST